MPDDDQHDDQLESLGADDPGSMAHKLARLSEGQVGEAPTDSEEELEAARLAEEARLAAEAGDEEAARKAQEADAKAADEAAAAEAAKKGEKPPELKYKTLEEAEKAAREAATRMHEATTEASELRKAREAAEAEAKAVRKELEELKAAQATRAAEEEAAKSRVNLQVKYATALKKIREIKLERDEETGEVIYPPNYDEEVAAAWAETGVDPEQVAKTAAKLAREELRREQEALTAQTVEERKAEERKQIRVKVETIGTAEGLDMTQGSADWRIFQSFVDELADNPEHEYYNKPLEDQVKWAANGVKSVLGRKIEMTDTERKAAAERQKKQTVLTRGITRPITEEPKRQRSMQEILAAQGNAA
jgi:hypothetical protein